MFTLYELEIPAWYSLLDSMMLSDICYKSQKVLHGVQKYYMNLPQFSIKAPISLYTMHANTWWVARILGGD